MVEQRRTLFPTSTGAAKAAAEIVARTTVAESFIDEMDESKAIWNPTKFFSILSRRKRHGPR